MRCKKGVLNRQHYIVIAGGLNINSEKKNTDAPRRGAEGEGFTYAGEAFLSASSR